MDVNGARRMLIQLSDSLGEIASRDPDQEVRGTALPVLDSVLSDVRRLLPNDSVIRNLEDVISVESVELGEPIRAVDMKLVVDMLLAALPPVQRPHARVFSPNTPPRIG
jgi:hypothetical protein